MSLSHLHVNHRRDLFSFITASADRFKTDNCRTFSAEAAVLQDVVACHKACFHYSPVTLIPPSSPQWRPPMMPTFLRSHLLPTCCLCSEDSMTTTSSQVTHQNMRMSSSYAAFHRRLVKHQRTAEKLELVPNSEVTIIFPYFSAAVHQRSLYQLTS